MNALLFEDLLDEALAQQRQNGRETPALSADPKVLASLLPLLETASALDCLLPVRMPNSDELAEDREAFLGKASQLSVMAVSQSPQARLTSRLDRALQPVSQLLRKRGQKPMSTLILRPVLILIMVLGSAGGVATLAADSLPGTPLYSLKLVAEDARLSLTDRPAEAAMLQLDFAETRLDEISELAAANRTSGDATLSRLQQHLAQLFYLAAQTPDDTMSGLLLQTGEMAQTQETNLVRLQGGAGNEVRARLQQTVQLMSQVQEACAAGLLDPQAFRLQHADREQNRFGQELDTGGGCTIESAACEPAGDQNRHGQDDAGSGGNGPGSAECPGPGECEPAGDQNRYGQDGEEPGGYGPGPAECPNPGECEPAGDQNRYGQDGEESGGHGPGPAECLTPGECEPAGDKNRYGQNGEESGGYGPGPAECPNPGECEPAGDQNRYGQDGEESGGYGPGPAECPNPGECEPAGDENRHGQDEESGQNGPPAAGDSPAGNGVQAQDQNQTGTSAGSDDSNQGGAGNGGSVGGGGSGRGGN